MIRAAAMAAWLCCAAASPAAAAANTAVLRPGATEPVIAYAARTRPRPAPVEDPNDGLRAVMVNVVMAMTGGFTLYTLVQHRLAMRTRERLAGKPKRRERPEPVPARQEVAPRLPLTRREQAEHLRNRRTVHAEAIERLMRRL